MKKKTSESKIPQKTSQNAAQRIQSIENSLNGMAQEVSKAMTELNNSVQQKLNILADEIDKISNVVSMLNKRLNAVIETTENKDKITKMLLDDAVNELKSKLDELVKLGALVKADEDAEIAERTFIVGREVDSEGNEVNPRVQFATMSLDDALKQKMLTKKVGDLVSFEEGQPKLEILEIYNIKEVKKDINFQEEQATEDKASNE